VSEQERIAHRTWKDWPRRLECALISVGVALKIMNNNDVYMHVQLLLKMDWGLEHLSI
jgi:hypothetical protein